MNWRKLTVWSTICLLGFSVFAGCGKKEAGGDPASVKQETEDQAGDTEENTSNTEDRTEKESAISDELAKVEKQAEEIEYKLQNESLTQFEMNKLSGELYTLWDDELNTIWKRLKETLDTDTMQKLTEEERQWIKDKDKQVESDGDTVGNGTARPMVEAMTGVELTKDRVYELTEYLK